MSFRILGIIQLPQNTFSRSGTGVSTSLIIIQKQKVEVKGNSNYNIYIKKIENIGYILNKKNTPYKYKKQNGKIIIKDGKPILDNDLVDCYYFAYFVLVKFVFNTDEQFISIISQYKSVVILYIDFTFDMLPDHTW